MGDTAKIILGLAVLASLLFLFMQYQKGQAARQTLSDGQQIGQGVGLLVSGIFGAVT